MNSVAQRGKWNGDRTAVSGGLGQHSVPDGLLRTLVDTAAAAIFTVDADQRITAVNRAFCEITGYAAEEVVGRSCALLARGGARRTAPSSNRLAPGRFEGWRGVYGPGRGGSWW
ncbi:MAG: PAS domain S-box protein [Verrucomicrobiales bacterium]|nr:PAS domain S-box protein [Verrucomicrobiales bacterium]